jgi:hypothetical protein
MEQIERYQRVRVSKPDCREPWTGIIKTRYALGVSSMMMLSVQ